MEHGHCIDDASRLCSLCLGVSLNRFQFSVLVIVVPCLRPEMKCARDQIGIYHPCSPCRNVSDFVIHCRKCVQLVHSSTRGHGWPCYGQIKNKVLASRFNIPVALIA